MVRNYERATFRPVRAGTVSKTFRLSPHDLRFLDQLECEFMNYAPGPRRIVSKTDIVRAAIRLLRHAVRDNPKEAVEYALCTLLIEQVHETEE